jgi:Cellulase (glycosyl hydrolase family 5)
MTAVGTETPGTGGEPSTRPPGTHRATARAGRRRRLPIVTGLIALLAAGTLVAVPKVIGRDAGQVCGDDALQAEAVAGLANFAGWLQRNEAAGFVGEVGWPSGVDGARWNVLADKWYDAADRIGMPVMAWAAARWPSSYPMAVYRSQGGSTLDSAGPQAEVVERHGGDEQRPRGVDLAGGSFGTGEGYPGFSSTRGGRYGYDYSYENAASYTFLADRGVRLVRLALSWERLQPVLRRPLDPAEVERVRRALDNAARAGLRVVLDLHGYGAYLAGTADGRRRLVLGSAQLPGSALADFWSRLTPAVAAEPALAALDLLNEPLTLSARGPAGARLWERISQLAVDAVRRTGSGVPVVVSGYGQTGPARWGDLHPRAWIRDRAGRVLYDAHVYFDSDGSGHYAARYDDELRRAAAAAPPPCHQLPDLAGTGPAPLSDTGRQR